MPRYEFGQFRLDAGERRFERDGQDVRLRGKVFDTLVFLLANAGRLVRKEELLRAVWPDTIVEENNLDHCVSQLRKTFGSENKYIETVPRQGYRFVAEVRQSSPTAPSEDDPRAASPWRVPEIPKQEIRFFDSADSVRIAYSTAGSGPPLVKAANWLNHLDFEWHSPIWAHWVSELTRHHTLYRYDERGNGLSDWNIQDFSFAAWVRDFEQLINLLKLEKFALLGISQGGAVAVSYAAHHPDRVSKLILYGAFARGWKVRNTPDEVERRNALLTLVRLGWGKDNPAFRQLWTTLFMPDATPEQSDWFNELQRVTTSPENAVQLLAEAGKINVVDLLPKVQCPTLVLHSRDEAAVPIKEGRLLAARIPGAKFVELPSRNHLVIPQEPAWEIFVRELGKFMEWDEAAAQSATASIRQSLSR
ncbi:MAG TPA: alpha/beta fold hydrolase [Candidatus Nanoarchaeia archaeon]|nr:alpha/beta fold hydrolase [Candidatus Nanoarchaeia archaeon]